jgi:acetyltransferase-like isoleucine patch superfamily enzyme
LPEIGPNVWIGPDCIVYGAVTIGEGATLLPGTTLTKSIPAGVVMQGNPARLVLRNFDNTVLRTQPEPDVSQQMAAAQGN